MTEPLQVETVGSTAIVTLNRPKQRNALDMPLREALAEAVPKLRDDPRIRAVVLTGAGGHFCAGADVKLLAEVQQGARDVFEGRERVRRFRLWFDELIDLEKPVIAAVEGTAAGAGLSLALAADLIFAAPSARFCAVFARVGYVPDMAAMYLLPRAIGLAKAKEMVFSARTVGAEEAFGIGLVHAMHPATSLRAAALATAERFAAAPAGALGLAKQMMNRAFESDRRIVFEYEAMAQSLCRESAFHREAVARFVGKEPPLYDWDRAAGATAPAPAEPEKH
jgi:2-(1,2-epoxy-1,2-dihydrophenyl)acetyl-CoA isomerase